MMNNKIYKEIDGTIGSNKCNTTVLVVFHPSHVDRPFTEHLTLHVDSVLSDQTHTSFSSSDTARTGSLSVILWVGSVQLIGLSCFGHVANKILQ
jgi:hypothetical protein